MSINIQQVKLKNVIQKAKNLEKNKEAKTAN